MRRAMMIAIVFLGGCLIGCESIQNIRWNFGIQSASETEETVAENATVEPTPEPEGG